MFKPFGQMHAIVRRVGLFADDGDGEAIPRAQGRQTLDKLEPRHAKAGDYQTPAWLVGPRLELL